MRRMGYSGRGSWRWLAVTAGLLTAPLGRAEGLADAWAIAVSASHQLRASAEQRGASEETLAAARATRLPTWDNTGGYIVLNHEPAYRSNDLPLVGPITVP